MAGLGTGSVGYVSTQRHIWRSTAGLADSRPCAPPPAQPLQPPEQLFGPQARLQLAKTWNQAVDSILTPLIEVASKRGL
ncbi:hypothetical protein WJX72_002743 [[Myrmecia] bisecta]|uniref:MICOS complex subunit MIC13 n=1 Tax=[Myrmecia] bisecta TaxID=41462 RepID=A0AAW1PJL3_9CHLO